MIPYLDGFSKRMELVACMASVMHRRHTREIEAWFEGSELDNILFSVLIHIMERTLTDESKCTLDDIETFLAEILPLYQRLLTPDQLRELTRYIIKDVLQNKGEPFTFGVMDYADGKMKTQSVRLIKDLVDEESEICYVLEKQGFDMLFRSKEVDDELGFQMEEIRLDKLIKKGNYSDAASQSTALIRMLNEKRSELILFERRLRNDLSSTSGEEYDAMIRSIHAMLTDEYETMEEIRKTLQRASQQIAEQTALTEKQDAEIMEAKRHLFQIEENVESILQKQRLLLTQSRKLGKIYQQILRESMLTHRIHSFDMEKVLLQALEAYDGMKNRDFSSIYAMLMNPLMLPELPKTLRLGLFYDPQELREGVMGDDVQEAEELEDESELLTHINRRNNAHIEIIHLLLQYAASHSPTFQLSEFWKFCLEYGDMALLIEEKRFFLVMLRLFELECVDITAWRQQAHSETECQGEFDLSWCLERIMEMEDSLYHVRMIAVRSPKHKTLLQAEYCDYKTGLRCSESCEIDDMQFDVEVEQHA